MKYKLDKSQIHQHIKIGRVVMELLIGDSVEVDKKKYRLRLMLEADGTWYSASDEAREKFEARFKELGIKFERVE